MFNLTKLSRWWHQHGFLTIVTLLVAFIALYPKLPLFEVLPGYRVRARLEDVLLGIMIVFWWWQVFRGKFRWTHPLRWGILAYVGVTLLSIFSAVLLTKTIPPQQNHILKAVLYWLRNIEYFSLSLLTWSAVASYATAEGRTRATHWVRTSVVVTSILVNLYGIGQKLFSWPLVSTMLREFSTGQILYLTPGARIQSTFAGHYDLAAYTVVTTPFILTWLLSAKKITTKLALTLSLLLSMWVITESASRISFAAFVVTLIVAGGLMALQQQTYQRKVFMAVGAISILLLIQASIMIYFGQEIRGRFVQLLRTQPGIYAQYTKIFPENPPSDNVLDPSDTRPVPYPPTATEAAGNTPVDVIKDIPEPIHVSTVSATGETITTLVERERIWSECAKTKSLSLCIRLETLWPKALAGFYSNPVLGSGYGTLNKDSVDEFTEAESTDNNFLRTLGETGLAGFVLFYGLVLAVMYQASRHIWPFAKPNTGLNQQIAIALIASSVGLLINALYIDVFVASKVAFAYWALVGASLGSWYSDQEGQA